MQYLSVFQRRAFESHGLMRNDMPYSASLVIWFDYIKFQTRKTASHAKEMNLSLLRGDGLTLSFIFIRVYKRKNVS